MSSEGLSRTHDDNPYGGKGFDWEEYIQIRPTYPDETFETIFDYHRAGGNEWNLALDVACGPGTGPTSTLVDHFKSVVGCDRNPEQLDIARRRFATKPSITFRQSLAEDLSWVEPGSVDIVTICTALHWLDIPTVIGEVARCLKPGGTFSAFTYAVTGTSGNAEIDKILGEAEGKALRRVLPPPETSSITRTLLETAHSHYDNVAIPPGLFTHETRVHWNKDSNVFYFQSNPAAVDRRNLSSEGYKEVATELKGLDSTYTREEFTALLSSLDHYSKQDRDEVVEKIWKILGPGGKLQQSRTGAMILARRR